MPKYYPAFKGRNKSKMNMFRLNKEHPVGHASRYPIGMTFPFRVDISFGKLCMTRDGALRINETVAIKKSYNKITTKEVWEQAGIPHPGPSWRLSSYIRGGDFLVQEFEDTEGLQYPLVMKLTHGSGGKGFRLIRNYDDLVVALGHVAPGDVNKYFFEPAFDLTREYRIHVSPHLVGKNITYTLDKPVKQEDGSWTSRREIISRNDGVIHEVRKMIRQEAADAGHTGARNFDMGNTYFTSKFNRPSNWHYMTSKAVEAIAALGLDFGFVDVLYNHNSGDFVFCESGSNPGMKDNPDIPVANLTFQTYCQAMKHIILGKAQKTNKFRLRIPITDNN